jgi:hypothetical protein
MNNLESIVKTMNVSAPIMVFGGSVIPTPNSASPQNWTMYLDAFIGRNYGTLAFFDSNYTARYFGYSNGTELTDASCWSKLLLYSVLFAKNQSAATGTSYATSVVDWMRNNMVTTLPQFVHTPFKYVDDAFYDSLAGVMSYRPIYMYWGQPVVYSLSCGVSKIFLSPFTNYTLSAVLLLGDVLYGSFNAYEQVLQSLLVMQNDDRLSYTNQTYALGLYNTIETDWMAKNFTAMFIDFTDYHNFANSLVSESVSGYMAVATSVHSALNATSSIAVALSDDMNAANQTICAKTTLPRIDGEVYGDYSYGNTKSVKSLSQQLNMTYGVQNITYQTHGSKIYSNFFSSLKGTITNASLSMDNVWNGTHWVLISNFLKAYVGTIIDTVRLNMDLATLNIIGYFQDYVKLIGDSSYAVFYGIAANFGSIIMGLVNKISATIMQVMQQVVSVVKELMVEIKAMMTKIMSVVSGLFTTLTGIVSNLTTYVKTNFAVIKNWTLSNINLIKYSLVSLVNETSSFVSQFMKAFDDIQNIGFFSQVGSLTSVLSAAWDNFRNIFTSINGVQDLGRSDLFKSFVNSISNIAQAFSSTNGYQTLVFGSNSNGLNIHNITLFGTHNGATVSGTGQYEIYDRGLSVVDAGNVTLTSGVGSIDTSGLSDSLYAVNVTIGSNCIVYWTLNKDSAWSLQNCVYGNYTVVKPATADGGTPFDIIVILNNLRYSNGTVHIEIDAVNQMKLYVSSTATADVTFTGNGTKSATLSMNINSLDESGTYTLYFKVYDEYSGATWVGAASDIIDVSTTWTQNPWTTWLLIAVGVAVVVLIGLVVVVYVVYGMRQNQKEMAGRMPVANPPV